MPFGLFDSFDNLDQIDIDNLTAWVKSGTTPIQLENYVANKILYPGSLPITAIEAKIEMAILREALKINGPSPEKAAGSMLGENPFLNITLRKIIIPEKFLLYIPDLYALTWAFVDGLLLNRKRTDAFEDLWTVVVSGSSDEIVGSVLLPHFEDSHGQMIFSLLGKSYKFLPGSLTVIPCHKDRCQIAYQFDKGQILGKSVSALEVYGGKLGLLIDGRMP